jgi:hypothetical protein
MKTFRLIAVTVCTALACAAPLASFAYVANGTLVKGASSSAVYFVTAGKRYAFPSEKIFFSWYSDFSSVQQISDADLASLPLTANITYRPGLTLVKITTDPKVYAVSRYGVLHWVQTEDLAKAFYGSNWNRRVADIPDEFFTNYIVNSNLVAANQYNANEEMATASNPAENIRPPSFTAPPPLPEPTVVPKVPTLNVNLSANQAVMNQTVYVFAAVTNATAPLAKIVIYSEESAAALATCLNATACEYSFTVNTAPLQTHFYAQAWDSKGNILAMPVQERPQLTVTSSSDQVQMQITPSTIMVGGRVSFTSNAAKVTTIVNHRIFALIPGEMYPVLWKDCGSAGICSDSSPFYRTTSLFSKVDFDGQSYQSPPVTVTVTGGSAPAPTLTLKTRPAPNQATLTLAAPSGETIGATTIVQGTKTDDQAIALCPLASCEITVQVSTTTSFTAFTSVGGKLEGSNSLTVTP